MFRPVHPCIMFTVGTSGLAVSKIKGVKFLLAWLIHFIGIMAFVLLKINDIFVSSTLNLQNRRLLS